MGLKCAKQGVTADVVAYASTKGLYSTIDEKQSRYQGRIVECALENDVETHTPSGLTRGRGWVMQKIRDDKDLPNDEKVYVRVSQSIQDGVTFANLVSRIAGATIPDPRTDTSMTPSRATRPNARPPPPVLKRKRADQK